MSINRRDFVRNSILAGAVAGLNSATSTKGQTKNSLPVVVSSDLPKFLYSGNRLKGAEKAMQMLRVGSDPLDAVVAGVNIYEDDPQDITVGYGGLPNEDGEVELDASVMHGATKRAGAVASLRYIKNPSKVAKLVMERTDHLLLVGEGALLFALAHGFKKEDLLTEESRAVWLRWKETMSGNDAWGPGLAAPDAKQSSLQKENLSKDDESQARADQIIRYRPTGTINMLAVNERGDIAGTTTTSGLSFKIPGRVGDSPLIGCGLFVDNEVGAAGATGRGEECIKINGAHTIVEMMRRGMSPKDACLEAVKRVSKNYNNDLKKLSRMMIIFQAVNKQGAHGAASLWNCGGIGKNRECVSYIVHNGRENKRYDAAYLYELPT
ncbi:MAG: N(4)-(beta-N-acetylglucosaminyl)-L-asparaginase [Acidobacteriota bacterium]|nr:N(4)-(beta-N-acetylglucosaminyl)-L-asparaginase [Acidobacteriota bacterium]